MLMVLALLIVAVERVYPEPCPAVFEAARPPPVPRSSRRVEASALDVLSRGLRVADSRGAGDSHGGLVDTGPRPGSITRDDPVGGGRPNVDGGSRCRADHGDSRPSGCDGDRPAPGPVGGGRGIGRLGHLFAPPHHRWGGRGRLRPAVGEAALSDPGLPPAHLPGNLSSPGGRVRSRTLCVGPAPTSRTPRAAWAGGRCPRSSGSPCPWPCPGWWRARPWSS